MGLVKIIFIIVAAIVGATFAALNRQEIAVRYFLGWEAGPFPLFLLIILPLFAGLAVGFAVGWRERRRLRLQARELGGRVRALQAEVETLTPKEKIPEAPPGAEETGKSLPG